jgi:predicted phage tail protein
MRYYLSRSRSTTVLIKVKPHSSFASIFSDKEYSIDITVYADIIFYLNSMHPRFINYIRQQYANKSEESYVFLDKNLKIINLDEMMMRKAKDNDIIHIVPAIVGGGGKRGGLLAVLAIAAVFIALPMLAGAAAAGAAAPVGASVAASGGLAGAIAGSPLLTNLVINIGLAMLTSLFSTKPKEETTRQNDMFGSLTNSVASGTPIALNYGMVRIAGQLISGYIDTTKHGKTVKVDVFGEVVSSSDVNYNTPESTQQAKVTNLLEGFNQYV